MSTAELPEKRDKISLDGLPVVPVTQVKAAGHLTVIENAYGTLEGERYLVTHRLRQCVLLAVSSLETTRTLLFHINTTTNTRSVESVWNQVMGSTPVTAIVVGNSDTLHEVPVEMHPWVNACAWHIRDKVLAVLHNRRDRILLREGLGQRTMRSTFAVHAGTGQLVALNTEELFTGELRALQTQRAKEYWTLDTQGTRRLKHIQDEIETARGSTERERAYAALSAEFLGRSEPTDMMSLDRNASRRARV
jgi:hypothetical protein